MMCVSFETKDHFIDGVFLSDKVGDIRFINFDNLKKYEGKEEDYEKLGKIVVGHYQECIGMALSEKRDKFISVDTMNRIRISEFPNVF